MRAEWAPTEQQITIIEETSPEFIVSAGAGSGKTWVLVQRYLRHINFDGFEPKSILTITFTLKAAAEMRMRIVQALMQEGKRDLARAAETGPIGTIHSFCERLLRQYAVEAGMDPEFEIIKTETTDNFLRDAIQKTLADKEANFGARELFISQEVGQFGWNSTGPYEELLKLIGTVVTSLRGSGLDVPSLRKSYESPESILHLWRTYLTQMLPQESHSKLNSILGSPNFVEVFTEELKKSKLNLGKKITSHDFDCKSALYTAGLMEIVFDVWNQVEHRMSREQKLDFRELERLAVHLLKTSPTTVQQVNQQYKVVMVDEAQDLNPVQYQLLEHLGIPRSMLIGDPNQSIYSFRQAVPELFAQKAGTWISHSLSKNHRSGLPILRAVDSVFQYHWEKSIVELPKGGEFDLDILTYDPRPFTEPEVELWDIPKQEKQIQQGAKFIAERTAELVRNGENQKDIALLVERWDVAKTLRDRLLDVGVSARIAAGRNGLFPRMEARDLANVLTCLVDLTDDFSLLATLRGPIVDISFDSIADLAMMSPVSEAVQSYMPQLETDRAKLAAFLVWYEPLVKVADRLSASEVISELCVSAGLLEAIARRPRNKEAVANIRKLHRIAAKSPEYGAREFAQMIREIQLISHDVADASIVDEDADAVTITTIHQAKGLEWPVVILADPFKNHNAVSERLRLDGKNGIVACCESSQGASNISIALHYKLNELANQEGLRALYVGMTRAQRKLCLALSIDSRDQSFSSWLKKVPDVKAALARMT